MSHIEQASVEVAETRPENTSEVSSEVVPAGQEAAAEAQDVPDDRQAEATASAGEGEPQGSEEALKESTAAEDKAAEETKGAEQAQAEPVAEGSADDQPMEVQTQLEEQVAGDEARSSDAQGVAVAEEQGGPTTPPAKGRKRPAAKGSCLEAMAAKIKRLREEADQAETAIAVEVKRLDELQNKIKGMREDAEAKRAAAQRAVQEYTKKQCEASIAELESSIPKRPGNPFVKFRSEIIPTLAGLSRAEINKKVVEMWNNISPEEKQQRKDRHTEATQKFNEWGNSEEGRKNLKERSELIKQCKAESMAELGQALMETEASTEVSETKPLKSANETPAKGMPAKRRRSTPAGTPSPTKEAVLDEAVLEEASKADLVVQLRNLAARPDVLALGKSSQELWAALKAHSGVVNAAKHALLSA